MDCLFCKIVNAEIPAKIFYQDDKVIVFDDLYPKAPQHKLIIPRLHITTLNDMTEEQEGLVGHMLYIAKKIAADLNIATNGYRLLLNCNADGGQAVYHLHLHLMGGRKMLWPPG
jgi:histidine triad (HIT) family protein